MNISFEQVEALREHAKVGYGDAKAALEATGGDMLEAIILLEKEGKVTPPQGGTYVTGGGQVSREKNEAAANAARQAAKGGQSGQAQEIYLESDKNDKDSSFGRQMKSLFDSFCRLVHKGNVNNFEIYRYGKKTISLPINVLILALLFCFWITLPLLVVGLFFNFRYRFYGPDIGKDTLNKFMDQASQTAKDIKQAVREDENAGKGDNQGNRG